MKPSNAQQTLSLLGFYSIGALRDIIPIYPLYSVVFIQNGITPLELSFLFIIWAAVGLFLEVPSGAIADAVSRKWLVVSSSALKSLGFLSWMMWQDFWGYALGFVLWGVGSSLRSGAFEALLFDNLKAWDRSSDFARHYSRIRSLGTTCVVIGITLGGLLIQFGYDTVLTVSVLVPLIVTVPFVLYVHDTTKTEVPEGHSYIGSAIREARSNRNIMLILLITTCLLTVHGLFDEYLPPLLKQHGFDLDDIAYLSALALMALALGQFTANYTPRLDFQIQIGLIGLASLSLLPAALSTQWPAIAAVMAFSFLFGVAATLIEINLQESIKSEARATVTSVISLGENIGYMIWFLAFGLVAEATSFAGATVFLSITAIILCIFFVAYPVRNVSKN